MRNNKHSKDIKLPLIGRVGIHHEKAGGGTGMVGGLSLQTNHKVLIRDQNGIELTAKDTTSFWSRFWNNVKANDVWINTGSGIVVYAGVRLMSQDTAVSAGSAALNAFNYHATGTGTTAATSTDTALQTAIGTTATAGTAVNAGASPNATATFTGVITYAGTAAVTEWGLFNQATLSGATMFDHQVFLALNMQSGWTSTHVLTLTLSSGG